ncbi:MAG: methyltransferase domain-containing protein [Planctomycetota bacterium]|jgi:hypothetical protein
MPSSDNVTVPYVSKIISSLRPASALDVGIGMGKFAFIFRGACEWIYTCEDNINRVRKENWETRLDGIEVCAEYITQLQRYLYDKIYIGTAQEIACNLGNYDLIHLGDVIEHLDKPEGQRLLDILFEKARQGILIVTPVGEYQQEGTEENPYEEHKSVWMPTDFRRFPCLWIRKVAKRQWIIFISRQMYSLGDPYAPRRSKSKLLRRKTRREKLKQIFRSIFGPEGLEFLLQTKRRLQGWKTNY